MSVVADTLGFGTKLEYGDTADFATAASWTEVTQIVDIEPPDISVAKVKTSYMNQAAKVHSYMPGWKDPGVAKVTMQWNKTLVNTIESTIFGVVKAWRVTYADGAVVKFNGFIHKHGTKVPMEDVQMYIFDIQTTGDHSVTA